MSKQTFSMGLLGLILAAALPLAPAAAQERPLVLVVGASAGGTTDRVARGIAKEMGGILKQTVIVENKPGAGGNIAADYVSRSAKDGNTLLVSFSSFSVNASLYKKLPFDPEKDFSPISMLAEVPSVLVARKDFPADSVAGLIQRAKAEPGKYSFAIGGIGSSLHMATASFEMASGIAGLNVPYKGTSPALQDLVGGQVDLMFASAVNVLPLIGSGRIKFLGVTSPEAMPQFPGVPPISGTLDGFASKAWFGMFGPAGIAQDRIAQLNKAVVEGARHDDFVKLIAPEGGAVVTSTPDELADFVARDIERYAKVVEFTGASVD
ncbi:tripartite tricarboxylate transporter substrate binding protein [Pollutimonas bauzanensis]|uniref:Tripartite-type tricarboxylate transporter, receptor component TctC n=1 Tax=Pollutimonas bauzanensis TaxID=658167 RepID=A0A1M5YFZ4_9BURK|nr:tripartite tricarboxylate transporter substrate binding protein [Pollutimonas bauzanensis]SHI10981.1 Tripartite-type tricarboxylate transporter, receptor component TctC [Pollutimonas bauzanensis]